MMGFQTAVKTCFSNYITFSGRAPRPEYWYFVLFLAIGSAVTIILDVAVMPADTMVSPFNSIFGLVTFCPILAVSIRRLHDVDKSGWWILLALVPLVGAIVLLVWYCSLGTRGDNRFGPNPLPAATASAMPA
jgi:uncharacterized membrane protein YhaH (DUF805 family)